MKLEEIGFYTLSNARADAASVTSRMMRAELLLGAECNFKCPYCRGVGGKAISLEEGLRVIDLWCKDRLFAIRFSGGEPLLNRHLLDFVRAAKAGGVERIAISTNGSAPIRMYEALIEAGVNDFSISLDACCASDGDMMAGYKGAWTRVVDTIRALAPRAYVTVGVVLTDDTAHRVGDIIRFASSLGVADVRVIPAAQKGEHLPPVVVDQDLIEKHPILRFRLDRLEQGEAVRGISESDSNRCGLVLDDMAVMEGAHYPCIIYMREGGLPIGKVGPDMRAERARWAESHDTHADPICSRNCLDVCVQYNNRLGSRSSSELSE